jgi:3-oxoacyl-[acyl-carrier protein] reductase
MDLGIAGRKAIICASSRGLGRGCALALAEAGVHITINGRDEKALEETAQAIKKLSGHSPHIVRADVSSKEGQIALLKACPDPDILVNNNGGPPPKNFREIDRNALLDGVVQNMVTPIELIQAVINTMIERKFGRIINITSSSVRTPLQGLDLSSGARAGLTGFLAGVAREVAQDNVTINAILPGMFDTDRIKSMVAKQSQSRNVSEETIRNERLATIPAGRFGTPEEFGKMCAFLASVHAGFITGQNILMDGGAFRSSY